MPDNDYHVSLFKEKGFQRRQCNRCQTWFWTLGDSQTCGETPCKEYDFIGSPPTNRPLSLKDMREAFLSFLESRDHTRVSRYPIVARWRDDVFFTQASIYPFQPWVVSGQEKPPANPLAISQPCVRFNDIHNVGRTGQHFTMFEMMAHHVFNYHDKNVYFKDRTVELCHEFMTSRLGVRDDALIYKEAWWSGGGNSGPCFEVILGGAEAATLVFMVNREEDGRTSPMDIQVVDTGYGLERLTWISQGTPSSYEAVFGDVLSNLKESTGARADERILQEYSKVAGMTKVETLADVREIRRKVAERIGIGHDELVKAIAPMENLYVLCDHTRALMFLLADGVVPSNVREGYFARLLVRRAMRSIETLGLKMRIGDIVGMQLDMLSKDFPELGESRDSMTKIVAIEEERFRDTLSKGRTVVRRLEERLASEGERIGTEQLVELYDSHGLNPEVVSEFASQSVEIPDDFYAKVAERHEVPEQEEEARRVLPKGLPETRMRVYEDERKRKFKAKVLAIEGTAIILDQTYFYPEGGGQEADHGTIGGIRITDVQRSGGSVLHFAESPPATEVGQEVDCEIDWQRRMNLVRNHTATHLLLAVARKVLGPHVWQAGAHKSEGEGRLDITHYDNITSQEKDLIERLVNEAILEDIQISKSFVSREQAERRFGFKLYQGGAVPGADVRVVQISELDVEACGGTHVDRTSEVGLFKILRTRRIQDGVVRLEYAAGRPAIDEMQRQSEALRVIAETLDAPSEQVSEAVKRMYDEWKEQRKEIERLNKEKMAAIAKGVSEEIKIRDDVDALIIREVGGVKVFAETIVGEAKDLITLAKEVLKGGRTVAVLGAEGSAASIAVGRSEDVDLDCRKVIALGAEIIEGKGGGKPDFAQGGGPNVGAVKRAVERMREEALSTLRSGAG